MEDRLVVNNSQRCVEVLVPEGEYRPGQAVRVRVQTRDASGQPVSTSGTLNVSHITARNEVGRTPWGTEVTRETFRKMQRMGVPLTPGIKGLPFEETLFVALPTDKRGRAEFTFVPRKEGEYHVVWHEDTTGIWRQAVGMTTVQVVKRDSCGDFFSLDASLVRLTVRGDAHPRPNTRLPLMIRANSPNRHILLIFKTRARLHWQLIWMKRRTTTVRIPLTDEHTPSFMVYAVMIEEGKVHTDAYEVVVHPEQHLLRIGIRHDGKGRLTITTRDPQGKPVSAEVALALVNPAALQFVPCLAEYTGGHCLAGRRKVSYTASPGYPVRAGDGGFMPSPLTEARRQESPLPPRSTGSTLLR